MEKLPRKLFIGLLIATLLTPVGILLPKLFNAGDAWGEWSIGEVKEKTGFVPRGMEKVADIWKAPVGDYTLGDNETSLVSKSGSYIASAVIGLVIIAVLSFCLFKFVRKE